MKSLNFLVRDDLVKYIFYIGLFSLAFVYWPDSAVIHEVPKVWFMKRFVETLFVVTLLLGIKQQRVKVNKLLITTLAFLLFATFMSLFGSDPDKSLIGNYYRWDGLITYYYLFAFALFVTFVAKRSWINGAIVSISLSSVLTSIYLIVVNLFNYLGESVTGWENNAEGIYFGNPNFLAGFLLVTLPLTLYVSKRYLTKFVYLPVVVQMLALFLTFSKTAFFGLGVFALLEIFTFPQSKRKSCLFAIVSLLFILVSLISFATWKSKLNPYTFTGESRQRIYTKALIATKEKPLIGWGWANFDHAFASIDWPIYVEQDVYVDKAHSNFLEIITTTGLIGGILYLLIIFWTIKSIRSGKDKYSHALLIALILYLIHSQTNVLSISEEIIFWLNLGIAMKGVSKEHYQFKTT